MAYQAIVDDVVIAVRAQRDGAMRAIEKYFKTNHPAATLVQKVVFPISVVNSVRYKYAQEPRVWNCIVRRVSAPSSRRSRK